MSTQSHNVFWRLMKLSCRKTLQIRNTDSTGHLLKYSLPAAATARHRWLSWSFAVGLVFIVFPVASLEVQWERFSRQAECRMPERPGVEISCGDLGVLFLRQTSEGAPPLETDIGVCPLHTSGTTTLKRYLSRQFPSSNLAIDPRDTLVPCSDGSCLTSIDQIEQDPDQPWVVILDWSNWHGWAVAWTILQTALQMNPNQPLSAVLLPVDEESLGSSNTGNGATDLGVLTQLCRLVDGIDQQLLPAPVVVNMSFGRVDEIAPAHVASSVQSSMFENLLDEVLEHLSTTSDAWGIKPTLVAAAGNHQTLLFPAAHPSVVSIGSLDVSTLKKTSTFRPSWESPVVNGQPLNVFPGSGICLRESESPGGFGWLAPPGSSFAAAMASGLLISYLAENPEAAGLLSSFSFTPETLILDYDAADFLAYIQGIGLPQCQPQWGLEPVLELFIEDPGFIEPLPEQSLPETVPSIAANQPTPAPDPCVPCIASKDNPSGSKPPEKARFSYLSQRRPSRTSDLLIDLSGTEVSLHDLGMELVALKLRVGQDIFPLLAAPGSDLQALERGDVATLRIQGQGDLSLDYLQPSLIWILRPFGSNTSDPPFWSSTPIQITDRY